MGYYSAREPDPRYTMILDSIRVNRSRVLASKVESGDLFHDDWHITSPDIY